MGFFERYLSVWVALCIVGGIVLGKLLGSSITVLSEMNLATVNIPVAILVWLMIFPMMVQIDFESIKDVGKNPKGLALTLVINWVIKPFTMAFFAWIFFEKVYAAYLSPELAQEYIAGAILLGAAPCTAMVFVWSYLCDGEPHFTLTQVTLNDLIMVFAFAPIVALLLGITNLTVPWETITTSVMVYILIPFTLAQIIRFFVIKRYGLTKLQSLLKHLHPFAICALLSMLVLLFGFQGPQLLKRPVVVLLIAVPIIIQVYFFI